VTGTRDATDRVEPTIWDALIGAAIGVLLVYLGTRFQSAFLKWPLIGLGWLFVVVMTGYALTVIWQRASPHLAPVFSRIRGDVRNDPQLGTLTRDRRGRCWEAAVAHGNRTIEVLIAGTSKPNPTLLVRARDLVAGFDALERQASAYLTSEADVAAPEDPELAEEIRKLRISSLKVWFPEHPDRVQIDFQGPDEDRFWSCLYERGELTDLDYD
jgi:hypothetical protein